MLKQNLLSQGVIFYTPCIFYLTWDLYIFQFERDKKSKFDGGLSGGSAEGDLDDFLSDMNPSEFYDDNLMRIIGLPWVDFLELVEMDNQGATFSISSRSASIASQGKICTLVQ